MRYCTDLTRIGESMNYRRFWRLSFYWNFRGVSLEYRSRFGAITPLVFISWRPK